MGQKVNPVGFRLGNQYTWSSRWFASHKRYQTMLLEDIKLREMLMKKIKPAGITKVEIERAVDKWVVTLHVSRPGIVIGRGGTGLEELKKIILAGLRIDPKKLELKVEEVRNPDLDAYLVAVSIADQLARRFPARRIMAQTIERVMRSSAKGVKILISGRIGGAEIARKQSMQEGTVPLHTIRANIDFAKIDSHTKSGLIGVKVWICK
jgi:small subunit ribosomal protein S3